MNDEQAEQMIHALVGIGTELTAIRQELQRQNDSAVNDSPPQYGCSSCNQLFSDESEAQSHARNAHGAPHGDEQDLIEAL